eukprot:scaffold4277_cov405-Prasinococcus_capsulatus_cf.AAC.5
MVWEGGRANRAPCLLAASAASSSRATGPDLTRLRPSLEAVLSAPVEGEPNGCGQSQISNPSRQHGIWAPREGLHWTMAYLGRIFSPEIRPVRPGPAASV